MLTTILVIVATFAFTIWPIKKAAEWLGAEKTGYGSVIFALFLSFVFLIGGALLAIPMAFLGTIGYIAIFILVVFLIGKAYSIALETPFWNGIGISIVGGIVGGILQLIFALVFGVSIMPEQQEFEGEVTAESIEIAAEEFCKCETDTACIFEQAIIISGMFAYVGENKDAFNEDDKKSINQSYKRYQSCAENPGKYSPPKKKKTVKPVEQEVENNKQVDIVESATTEEKPVVKKDPEPKPEYHWRDADVSELPQLMNKNFKVETTRGRSRAGRLVDIADGVITIEKSKNLSFPIPISEIKEIKVYTAIQ